MESMDENYTRPATWDDVVHVCRLLNEAGVEYLLIGGYAIFAHGFNRQSDDIDLSLITAAITKKIDIRECHV